MKKQLLQVILLTFLFSLGFFSHVKAEKTNDHDFELMRTIDSGLMLREEKSSQEFIENSKELIMQNAAGINFNTNTNVAVHSIESNFTYNGGTKYFLGMDLGFKTFTLRSVGPNVEIWVANDLSYGYNNPNGPDIVTQNQVDLLRDEFENNIYPTLTAFFGDENYHNGSNSALERMGILPKGYYASSEGKKIILVDNIKDASYYSNGSNYTAGFYWQTLEYYIDRNIVTLDSYAWHALMPNNNPNWQSYQYNIFGTLAHEFQHLIHADNDPYEEMWINEGMSSFAQYISGYGHNWNHVNAFLNRPENSLLIWGDYNGTEILADYGQAYLFQLYLNEQYGSEFMKALATNPFVGIDSINRVLSQFNIGIDFHELFKQFSIAVAIDTNEIGNGIYNFSTIDLNLNFTQAGLSDKEGVPAWGANYKQLDFSNKIDTIHFTSQDFAPMTWQVNNGTFHSNVGNLLDEFLIFEADLTNLTKATLEFDHWYNIERYYDFGFVQVSLDGGKTWVTLQNENTSSLFASWNDFPNIGEQLPGFTGIKSLTHERFDLTPYVGQKIHIGFRYMTDISSNGNGQGPAGWFIDSISIPELHYYNDCNTLNGFVDLNRLFHNYLNYSVVFINETTLKNGKVKYKIVSVDLFNQTDEDALQLRQLFKEGNNYMIVWYVPNNNSAQPASFDYEVITKK